jgi:DNA-binding response OmpR family regulator
MWPGLDGFEVCRRMRTADRWSPVLMLTARGTVADRVAGLNAGADDYLVKPFAFAELLARLRALLRPDFKPRELSLRAGDLVMDLLDRRVVRAGVELDLTGREYELLEYLLRHKGEVVDRDMIALDVWKETTGAMTNVINVYINALRKKVERPDLPPLIHTVRGLGYVLKDGA